jgi:chromosome segregation ATPase
MTIKIEDIYLESDFKYPLVVQACDRIAMSGGRPSAKKVREEIGKGSNTELQAGVDEWWDALVPRLNYYLTNPAMDRRVIDAAAKLWKMAQRSAGEDYETARHEFELQKQELGHCIADLEKAVETKDEELKKIELQLATSQASEISQRGDIERLNRSLVDAQGKLAAANATAEGLQEVKQGLEDRLEDVSKQLSSAKEDCSTLQQDLSETSGLLAESRMESATRQRDIASLHNQIEQIEQMSAEAVSQANKRADTHSAELAATKELLAVKDAELAMEKKRGLDLEGAKEECDVRISKLSLELENSAIELSSLRESKIGLEATLRATEAQLDQSERRMDKLLSSSQEKPLKG